jgi:hypothetical protein
MSSYTQYYVKQAHTGVGGSPPMIGHGLGSLLSKAFKFIYPMLKSGFSAVKDEFLKGGVGLLQDTIQQVPIKDSIKKRVQEFGDNLTSRAVTKVGKMSGSGRTYKRGTKAKGKQSGGKRGKKRKQLGRTPTTSCKSRKKKTKSKTKKPVKRLQKKKKSVKPKQSKKKRKKTTKRSPSFTKRGLTADIFG